MNVAVTLWLVLIVTTQLPVPLHAPDQPLKLYPDAGVAVRVTAVPALIVAEQVEPQEIEPPELETVPEPTLATERVYAPCATANVAVTLWLALIVTLQVPVPLQAPDQPLNV